MKKPRWVYSAIWIHRIFWVGFAITLFFLGALITGYSDLQREKVIVSMLSKQPVIVLTNFNYRDWDI